MPEFRVEELGTGSGGILQGVVAIERRSFRHPWTLAEFQFLAADARALNVGLWCDGRLVGYAMGHAQGTEFHLANLAVEPSRRRRGFATRLLESILEKAWHRGCTACRLEVRPSNKAARALYEKFGFEAEGEISGFYTGPEETALRLRGRIRISEAGEIHREAENT